MMGFAALNPSHAVLKVVMVLMPAWQDAVRLGAEDITRLCTDHRVRRGTAYMSELGVFLGLTIDENIRIGGQFAAPGALRGRCWLLPLRPSAGRAARTAAGVPCSPCGTLLSLRTDQDPRPCPGGAFPAESSAA